MIRYNGQKYLFFIFGISTTSSFLSISDNEGIIVYLDERKILNRLHDSSTNRDIDIFLIRFSQIPMNFDYLLIHLDSQKQ